MATPCLPSLDDRHGCRHRPNALKQSQVAVVMVPLAAQGHLNQLLQLSRLIAGYNIPIHYVSTASHNRQAKLRIHGWDPSSVGNLHFHDFSIPEFTAPAIDPNAVCKFPSHLQPLFNTLSSLRRPLTALLHTLSQTSRRVVVIHDSMMSSVVRDAVTIPNAESYTFHSVSVFTIFCYFWETLEKHVTIEQKLQELEIPSLDDCFTSEFLEFIASEHAYIGLSSGSLYNSSRVMEGKFMDLVEKLSENHAKKRRSHWAIGPFNPLEFTGGDKSRHDCLKWLDTQPPNSVVLVSFGTTTSLSGDEIEQLAVGLEQSGLKFIWVLRGADKGDNFAAEEDGKAELPEGFAHRIRGRGRGIVLKDWVPQLEILAHSSTGGFLSHCGWNSCMESISMGVPIAACPMHSDQPRNAILITKVLRVGLSVKDWERRREVVKASEVSSKLRRLMSSEEGDELRQRAVDLSITVRRAVAEGGATRQEFDSFIGHITR